MLSNINIPAGKNKFSAAFKRKFLEELKYNTTRTPELHCHYENLPTYMQVSITEQHLG